MKMFREVFIIKLKDNFNEEKALQAIIDEEIEKELKKNVDERSDTSTQD
jgi:hypothetical protein